LEPKLIITTMHGQQHIKTVNTVQFPTRITKSTSTLIDVIIINKRYYMEHATVTELRLSDHQAQALPVLRKNHASVNRRILKRHF